MNNFQIPILMYHEVTTEDKLEQVCNKTQRTFVLTLSQFEAQMKWLAKAGYSTISLYDVVNIIQNENSVQLPNKPIIITFDDGYEGNYLYALPILKQFGFTAVFFIVVNRIGTPYMMDWWQLKQLVSSGMSIQSHTMTHPLLGKLDRDGVAYELKESKQELQNKLQIGVDFVSLPYGSYNEFYKDIAIEAGYQGGCSSKIGLFDSFCDRYLINRITLNSKYSLDEFKQIAEGRTDYIRKVISKRKFRDIVRKIMGEEFYVKLHLYIYGIEE